jgi:hypothetical protein
MYIYINTYIHTFILAAQAPNTFLRANSDSFHFSTSEARVFRLWRQEKKG